MSTTTTTIAAMFPIIDTLSEIQTEANKREQFMISAVDWCNRVGFTFTARELDPINGNLNWFVGAEGIPCSMTDDDLEIMGVLPFSDDFNG